MISVQTLIARPSIVQGLKIYPPLVKEIDDDFLYSMGIITTSIEDIEDHFSELRKLADEGKINLDLGEDFVEPTPLEFILANCHESKTYEEKVRKAFQILFKKEITILYEENRIFVGNLEQEILNSTKASELIFIEEDNFFEIQNGIRRALGRKEAEKPDPDEHPKVKEFKARMRYRDKVKAKSGKGVSLEGALAAICCTGIGITPLNIGEMSYAAVTTLLSIYQDKESYEVDLQSILAGADSKKVKPKYWIGN